MHASLNRSAEAHIAHRTADYLLHTIVHNSVSKLNKTVIITRCSCELHTPADQTSEALYTQTCPRQTLMNAYGFTMLLLLPGVGQGEFSTARYLDKLLDPTSTCKEAASATNPRALCRTLRKSVTGLTPDD